MPHIGRLSAFLILALLLAASFSCWTVTHAPAYHCLLWGVRAVVLTGAGMACRLALAKGRYAVPAHGWLLLAFLLCVIVGDFVYAFGVGLERYPRNTVNDFAFGAGFACMAILASLYLRTGLSRSAWGFVVVFAALSLLGQWAFVLEPSGLRCTVPAISIVSVAIYSLSIAILAAFAALEQSPKGLTESIV